MSKINELQDKLLNIETQINCLINEKSSVTAELESLKHQQAKEAVDKVVGELKALNLDPLEIARALGVPVAQPTQKKTRAARGTAPVKVPGVPMSTEVPWTPRLPGQEKAGALLGFRLFKTTVATLTTG